MPKDVDMGKALATTITAANTGRIKSLEFTLDPYLEYEADQELQAWVTVDSLKRERLSRGGWQKDITLLIFLFVPQKPDEQDFVERWLGDFDTLLDLVSEVSVLGNKPSAVEQEERYDRAELHNAKRLVCAAKILYKLV